MIRDSRKERILVMAHAHPDFSLGGGERAAYDLYSAYRNQQSVEQAWFLARADRGRGNSGAFGLRRDNEYLWEQGIGDWHLLKAAHRESVLTGFAELLHALKPTIVHAHHYMHLGLEFLRVIKQVDPAIKTYLTLHEYMAICRNNGQMVKTYGNRLCNRATIEDCRRCFPQHSAEDFWLREHFVQRHFDCVDGFVAPSAFLRQRYVDWGVRPERIVVIENGQADAQALPARPIGDGEPRNRFGFFGQITPFKGLDVVLEGLSQLPRKQRRNIVLEVHGANLELQAADYRKRVESLRAPLMDEGVVQWIGPYEPRDLPSRFAGVDWVIVPSIWWENSPMVIQEAFTYGRPLLVSNIGGMAEKVRDGVDGRHVAVGNRKQWAEAMSVASREIEGWEKLRDGITRPTTYDQCARVHLSRFRAFSEHCPGSGSGTQLHAAV